MAATYKIKSLDELDALSTAKLEAEYDKAERHEQWWRKRNPPPSLSDYGGWDRWQETAGEIDDSINNAGRILKYRNEEK